MTIYFRNRYRSESTRRKGFDYSWPCSCFITICTKNREPLFGEIITCSDNQKNIISQKMVLNIYGEIVKDCWYDLPNHYEYIKLDAFSVMPEHVHGIIIIENPLDGRKYHGLPEFIRAFKSFSSRRISEIDISKKSRIWHNGYYDHIIRSHDELETIRHYVIKNPDNWGRSHLPHIGNHIL